MIIAKVALVFSALLLCLFSYLVWSKQRFKLLAGFVEGSIKDEDRKMFAKANGLMLMIIGIWTLIFSLILSDKNFNVYFTIWIVGIIVGSISHVVLIDIRFKKL